MDRLARINMVWGTEYWDGIAAVKEWNKVCYGYATEEEFFKFTEPIEDLNKSMKFLDFGCGPGRIVKTVAPNVKEYVGVDVSAGLLEIAKEHHKEYSNVKFIKGNGSDLDVLEDNTFDYIYERLVFIHVPKEGIRVYIGEFLRVLKPGGIACFPDLPKDENMTNGFTPEEVKELFKDFTKVNIDDSAVLYNIKATK